MITIQVTQADMDKAVHYRPDANAVVQAMLRQGFEKAWANQSTISWAKGKSSYCIPMPTEVLNKLLDLQMGVNKVVEPFSFEIH